MRKEIAFLISCMLLIGVTTHGQEINVDSIQDSRSSLDVVRDISIREDSKPGEIFINIDKTTAEFDMHISSQVSKGELTIEVYDSLGKKQGNFTIETQYDSMDRESVSGAFKKSWKNIPAGQWKLKIIPSVANAEIHIVTSKID